MKSNGFKNRHHALRREKINIMRTKILQHAKSAKKKKRKKKRVPSLESSKLSAELFHSSTIRIGTWRLSDCSTHSRCTSATHKQTIGNVMQYCQNKKRPP